ncbi:MAG: ABC transporter substrate-binding protein, partial [Dongiaceae bacterium]
EVSIDSLSHYLAQLPEHTKLVQRPGLLWTWMGMNTEHPKLSDHRVREAICLAVDVDTILQAAYAGLAPRSYGIIPPGLIGHRDTYRYATRNVEKAKALVAEAGAEGLEIDIKIINKTDQNTAASVIQANLAEIGIDLTIVPLESGTWWDLGLESRGDAWKDLQLYIARYGDAPDPSQMTQWYVSGQVGIWNWERWKNPEFDELFDKGLGETDPAKRQEIYVRMQEIMDDNAAYVYITHEPRAVVHRDHFNPIITLASEYFFPLFTWA